MNTDFNTIARQEKYFDIIFPPAQTFSQISYLDSDIQDSPLGTSPSASGIKVLCVHIIPEYFWALMVVLRSFSVYSSVSKIFVTISVRDGQPKRICEHLAPADGVWGTRT